MILQRFNGVSLLGYGTSFALICIFRPLRTRFLWSAVFIIGKRWVNSEHAKRKWQREMIALFRVVIMWCLHEAMRSLASGMSCFLKTLFYMVHLKMYFLEKLSWFLFFLLVLLPDHLTLVSTPELVQHCRIVIPWNGGRYCRGHRMYWRGTTEKLGSQNPKGAVGAWEQLKHMVWHVESIDSVRL